MHKRMMIRELELIDLSVGETYILMKRGNLHEFVFGLWTGTGWSVVSGGTLDSDWPDSIFENPRMAEMVTSMTLDEYQARARETAVYPGIGSNLTYPTLGLCGEAGEFAEKLKKSIRDDGGKITDSRKEDMIKELGDVMWYIASCASEIGLGLGEVARRNVEKLASRAKRDALHGSGDHR